ncbi:MAG: DUF1189 family protein [Elusimicrobiaceae bacterium]|nr:DUF1189 family protein [Elusimicrobiaceae bacterium]
MLLIHLRTLFSFRFYHQLSFVRKGLMAFFGIYLFFLSLLVVYFASASQIRHKLPILLKNFPEVTFEKGFLTAPQTPVSFKVPSSGIELIFDASKNAVPPQHTTQSTLLWIHENQLHLFANGHQQSQVLPSDLTFVTSQQNLEKYQGSIALSLRLSALIASFFLIAFVMLLSFCLAFATGLLFKLLRNIAVPYAVLVRWAFFLLGPLSILWYIRLWINIPLFSFAQLILCIIYMQQIFNLIPEDPSHAH